MASANGINCVTTYGQGYPRARRGGTTCNDLSPPRLSPGEEKKYTNIKM